MLGKFCSDLFCARLHRTTVRLVPFVALLGLAVLALAFAHAWDSALPNTGPRAKCFETFWTAQWPKWIGCAMAAHESLAAGLIGLWAAIFAAWLAYSGIRMQIDEERRNIQRQIEEERGKAALGRVQAKATASIAITQVEHAAAATLYAVKQAQKAKDQQQIPYWDDRINQGVSAIGECLDQFAVKKFVRDLVGGDRLIYLGMIGQMGSFVTVHKHPSPHLNRATRLQHQNAALMKLRELLAAFDSDLAASFDRDAEITEKK